MRVGWDVSHLEFTITDYYYFGKLQRFLSKAGLQVAEVPEFTQLVDYDVIVFNYPEQPFTDEEIGLIRHWVHDGKSVIFAGYYKDEDHVGTNINQVAHKFGLSLDLADKQDPTSDDPYYFNVVTKGGLRGVFPCSDTVSGGEPVGMSSVGPVISEVRFGKGRFVLLGSCVFWDSFSLYLKDNAEIALRLLTDKDL
ncbi:hypothetical protein HPY42_03965 [Coprothermobacteraceae bacterium]|nr:hypothetical protein [Coprothermobacteraceae bacterium]